MEVHAHTSRTSGTRKKWTHYFWEFLMLFLAVFCGFLAEYQLEHKIEKDRAKQYVLSFYEDLKTDTAQLARLLYIDKNKVLVLEGVRNCYDTVMADPASGNCLLKVVRNSRSFINFINTERTLQQLKNAGGMRMLNKEDADSIYAYDNRLRRYISFESDLLQERQTNLRNMYTEFFNYPDLNALQQGDTTLITDGSKLIFSVTNPQLNKLFNQLAEYTRGMRTRINFLTGIHSAADRMLHYFNSKYNLE
jgi:hypothetical protein